MTAAVRTDTNQLRSARERIGLILSRLEQLPTLPAVAAKLLAVVTSDTSSARDVVEIVESDPALTSAILRMASRANLGVEARGLTVKRAVTLLGFKAVRNAVLSIQVYEALSPPAEGTSHEEARRELWKHSLAVACAADVLTEGLGGSARAGEAFVCGLLHDIGKIALDACLPKSYARVISRVERERVCICDAERELFGMDHTVAGKHLAKRWELPAAVVECVWLHHQEHDALPAAVADAELLGIVHLADNIVRGQRVGFSGYQHVDDVEALATRIGIGSAALAETIKRLPERMAAYSALVGLDDSTSRTLYLESLTKANRELGRLNAELAEINRGLQLRAACFRALQELTRHLSKSATPTDVCAAAARCALRAFESEGALAVVGDSSCRCMHVGYADAEGNDTTTAVLELNHERNRELLVPAIALRLERKVVPSPEGGDILWHRCTSSAPQGPLWTLPFIETNSLIGAVFFVAAPEKAAKWQAAETETHALSSAIELAMLSAKATVEAESLNDELLDTNRRLRTAQEELVKARSMSMIAQMAAGAAHELNNPLSVISGRAQMAAADCQDESVIRTLSIIKDRAHEASEIVTELMHFAKPDPPQGAAVKLAEVFETLCQHWRSEFSLRPAQLTSTMADAGAAAFVDRGHLREILDALVKNAVEAGEPETLRVELNSPSLTSDERVRIVVADNGPGMDAETLAHAADPFFSRRPAGRGRGLGLPRAYRLVEVNGGRLWLESTAKVGTTVTIELPARAPAA